MENKLEHTQHVETLNATLFAVEEAAIVIKCTDKNLQSDRTRHSRCKIERARALPNCRHTDGKKKPDQIQTLNHIVNHRKPSPAKSHNAGTAGKHPGDSETTHRHNTGQQQL
jgi:hypothetical protein